jgi:hypothetical protein
LIWELWSKICMRISGLKKIKLDFKISVHNKRCIHIGNAHGFKMLPYFHNNVVILNVFLIFTLPCLILLKHLLYFIRIQMLKNTTNIFLGEVWPLSIFKKSNNSGLSSKLQNIKTNCSDISKTAFGSTEAISKHFFCQDVII